MGGNGQRPGYFIRETVVSLRGSAASIQRNRFGYREVCTRWIPHILTSQQKRDRVAYSTALFNMYEIYNPGSVNEQVTDETWLFYFEPLRKATNKAWVPKGGNTSQIARRCRPQKKVLHIIFFFFAQRASCNRIHARQERASEHHYWVLLRLSSFGTQQILQKKLDQPQACVESNFFMMTHLWTYKAGTSVSLEGKQTLQNPPYSLDFAPCDFFFLFPKLKEKPHRKQIQLLSSLLQTCHFPVFRGPHPKRLETCIWTMDTKMKEASCC